VCELSDSQERRGGNDVWIQGPVQRGDEFKDFSELHGCVEKFAINLGKYYIAIKDKELRL
jgi:hypothetical protein